MFNSGLQINVPKCGTIPQHKRRQLGFDVDLAEGLLTMPIERCEALQSKTDAIMSARNGRVQARVIASLVGAIISMRLAWGPVTQLYSRHLYAIINDVPTLNWWLAVSEEAASELLFWHQLPRLRFDADIWPSVEGVSIRVATDATNFGWGGTPWVAPWPLLMSTSISLEESVQSSTYRELLAVIRCLQSVFELGRGKFVVFQVDARNLLGIVNRGRRRLPLNQPLGSYFGSARATRLLCP